MATGANDVASNKPGEGQSPANPGAAVERTLVARHHQFRGFLRKRVSSDDVAEELLQTCMVRALEKKASLQAGERVDAWFYRLLRNALVDHFRHHAVEVRALERAAHDVEGATTPAPELTARPCHCLATVISTLKPSLAHALRAVDLRGEPIAAFALAEAITTNNAHVRLHRARQALREHLIATCGTCASHGCLDCTCNSPAQCRPL
jgi:RNA polymerase sigma factor (sigma-70 family)